MRSRLHVLLVLLLAGSVHAATAQEFGPGRHMITRPLSLTSNQVLRGAGSGNTTLYFPQGLVSMGAPCRTAPQDCHQWGGGVISLTGTNARLQGVTIEFPPHAWEHWSPRNQGYNGVNFAQCTHCSAEDVVVRNADVGIVLTGSAHVTVENTAVYANPSGAHIHYADTAGQNSTINDFKAYGDSVHGLAGNWGAQNITFSNGWGTSLRLEPDHNGPATENMLYQNITGRIKSIQQTNRTGRPVDARFINVGGH